MNICFRYLSTRTSISRFGFTMSATTISNPASGPYGSWTREQLIERLTLLEKATQPTDIHTASTHISTPTSGSIVHSGKKYRGKEFNFQQYARRKIALKFCYSGWEYGGLAFQLRPTPVPTVENVIFDMLVKAKLVDPEGGFDGCGWEKCGRTDRGVSAAGQVITLWIRSKAPPGNNQPIPTNTSSSIPQPNEEKPTSPDGEDDFGTLDLVAPPATPHPLEATEKPKPFYEHDYLNILNKLLPDTIRILAWSPVSDKFSARFSCKFRHYKYFFSSHSLDIPSMQKACERLLGEHDFRNLCKIDAQKQITSFRRTILRATIEPLEPQDPTDTGDKMYVFDLIGTAFLYHQVRHIMAVLFLVGTGLENPSIVTQLMNVEQGLEAVHPDDTAAFPNGSYPVVNSKPEYWKADALPLMLWDCAYDPAELDWRTTGKPDDEDGNKATGGDLYRQVHSIHNQSRVYAALDQYFLRAVGVFHPAPVQVFPLKRPEDVAEVMLARQGMDIPLGGGTYKRTLKYVSVMSRKRLDTVEVINERWRLGKESRVPERMQGAGEENDGDE